MWRTVREVLVAIVLFGNLLGGCACEVVGLIAAHSTSASK